MQLKNMGIVGGSGGAKFVTQHVKDNTDYGVILTTANLEKLGTSMDKVLQVDLGQKPKSSF